MSRILLVDGHHGIYAGMILAHNYGNCLKIDQEDLGILLEGPDHEHYFEACSDLDMAQIEIDGSIWDIEWYEGEIFASIEDIEIKIVSRVETPVYEDGELVDLDSYVFETETYWFRSMEDVEDFCQENGFTEPWNGGSMPWRDDPDHTQRKEGGTIGRTLYVIKGGKSSK